MFQRQNPPEYRECCLCFSIHLKLSQFDRSRPKKPDLLLTSIQVGIPAVQSPALSLLIFVKLHAWYFHTKFFYWSVPKNIKTKLARVAWLKLQTWEILEEPLEVWNLLRKIGKSDEQSVCARGSSPAFSNKETLCTFSIASSESFSEKTDWIKETGTIVQEKLLIMTFFLRENLDFWCPSKVL